MKHEYEIELAFRSRFKRALSLIIGVSFFFVFSLISFFAPVLSEVFERFDHAVNRYADMISRFVIAPLVTWLSDSWHQAYAVLGVCIVVGLLIVGRWVVKRF